MAGQGLLRIRCGGTGAQGLEFFVVNILNVLIFREGGSALNMVTESPIIVDLARVIMVGVGVGRVAISRPQGEHISLVTVRVGIARKEADEVEEIFIINTGLPAKEVLSIGELICVIQGKQRV